MLNNLLPVDCVLFRTCLLHKTPSRTCCCAGGMVQPQLRMQAHGWAPLSPFCCSTQLPPRGGRMRNAEPFRPSRMSRVSYCTSTRDAEAGSEAPRTPLPLGVAVGGRACEESPLLRTALQQGLLFLPWWKLLSFSWLTSRKQNKTKQKSIHEDTPRIIDFEILKLSRLSPREERHLHRQPPSPGTAWSPRGSNLGWWGS